MSAILIDILFWVWCESLQFWAFTELQIRKTKRQFLLSCTALTPANQWGGKPASTYPKMLEMESSRLPGGGWEIFLLLKPKTSPDETHIHLMIICHDLSIFIHLAVIQAPLSPGGSAQRFVWWNFFSTFPSILSQHLYVIVPESTNSKLDSTSSSKPELSCSMITLTGQWAVALWQHQRAPSAIWPVCAWKTQLKM